MLHQRAKAAIFDRWFPASYPLSSESEWLSLHHRYSPTGDFELAGGGYQRAPMAWFTSETIAPSKDGQSNHPLGIQIPAGAEIRFGGLWDAPEGGSFLGMFPHGQILNNAFNTEHGYDGNPLVPFIIDETPTTWVRSARHPYFGPDVGEGPTPSNGWQVVYWSASRQYNTMSEMAHGETIMTLVNVGRNGFELVAEGESSVHTWHSTGMGFFQRMEPVIAPVATTLAVVQLSLRIHGARSEGVGS